MNNNDKHNEGLWRPLNVVSIASIMLMAEPRRQIKRYAREQQS